MELAANGHSTREIGEVLGVDHSTVVRDGANAPQDEKHDENTGDNLDVYPYALRTRKSAGLMTRKLSVTESQKTAQFFGTSSRRKCRTERQNSL